MNIFEAIIISLVQGITEWLPISSSGHIALVEHFLKVQSSSVLFVILLHFASALVVLFMFRKDFALMLKEIFKGNLNSTYGKKAKYLIIATIPIALIGVFLKDIFELVFFNVFLVIIFLFLTGVFLLFVEKYSKNKNITLKNSFIIGLAQIFAIFPGISRSGVTIGTGLLLGIKKQEAAKFSFMLAVPLLIGAGIYELIFSSAVLDVNLFTLILGMLITSIASYFSINFLFKIITKGKFWYFGIYCILLSFISLLIIMI